MKYENGKFYEILNEATQANTTNKTRLVNLKYGSIIVMKDVDIINATKPNYHESRKRPYVYLGNRTILSCDKNNQWICQYNKDIIDELETHNWKTFKKDSNGKYIYKPKDWEVSIDDSNSKNLKGRLMAQGISYATFFTKESVSFAPKAIAYNVDEVIDNLENYSNILIENVENIINVYEQIDLNFNYKDILVEKITDDNELWCSLETKEYILFFFYDYLSQTLLIQDQDSNFLEIDNFESENLSVDGGIYNFNGNEIDSNIINSLVIDLQQILIEVDNYVFSNNVIDIL